MRKIAFGMSLVFAFSFASALARADETVGEKAQTQAESANRDTKQTVRKAKKKHRDTTGHKNHTQDAKDAGKNASEDVSGKAKELERKAD